MFSNFEHLKDQCYFQITKIFVSEMKKSRQKNYIVLFAVILYVTLSSEQANLKEAYFNQLMNIQTNLKKQILQLKSVNTRVQQQKQKYEKSPLIEQVLIQQGMQFERPKLIQIQKILEIPYQNKIWQCQNLTKYQENQIKSELKNIQTEIEQIQSLINIDSKCARDVNIQTSVTLLQNRMSYLNKQLINVCEIKPEFQKYCTDEQKAWNGFKCIDCQKPRIYNINTLVCQCAGSETQYFNQQSNKCQKVVNIPNLSSKQNWIYGENLNVDAYTQKMNELAMQKHVVKCANDKPFVNNKNECIQCQQNKVFDLSTNECAACQQNKILDVKTHQCMTGGIVDGQTIICQEKLFWTGRTCLKCETPGVFDYQKKQCVCDQGFLYDSQNEICNKIKAKVKNTNPGVLNFQGDLPEYDAYSQNCPIQTPYFDGQQCIECKLPKYYDLDIKKCDICDNALVFDISTRKCITPISKQAKFNSNFKQYQIFNYAGTPPEYDSQTQDCPSLKPYFDSFNCVPCSRPFYFNFTNNKCQACPSSTSFSQVSKTCEKPKIQREVFVSNINPNVTNFRGTQKNQANANGSPNSSKGNKQNGTESDNKSNGSTISQINGTKVKTCPIQNPFYNGKQCISCLLPHYFSFDSLKCQSCPPTQQFSSVQKNCVQKKPSIVQLNNNLVDQGNFKGDIPKFSSAVQNCPLETPFFNGRQCVSCKLPQYFDFSSKLCTSCRQNQYFSVKSRQCEYHKQRFVTDIKNPNIYYNGDYSQVIQGIQTKLKSDPTIQFCPSQKPFYNPNLDDCVTCQDNKPLYDVKFNKCISCHNGSYFSQEKHFCVSEGVVAPTVQRMFMNTFSWV